jgi:hypothetical protein
MANWIHRALPHPRYRKAGKPSGTRNTTNGSTSTSTQSSHNGTSRPNLSTLPARPRPLVLLLGMRLQQAALSVDILQPRTRREDSVAITLTRTRARTRRLREGCKKKNKRAPTDTRAIHADSRTTTTTSQGVSARTTPRCEYTRQGQQRQRSIRQDPWKGYWLVTLIIVARLPTTTAWLWTASIRPSGWSRLLWRRRLWPTNGWWHAYGWRYDGRW